MNPFLVIRRCMIALMSISFSLWSCTQQDKPAEDRPKAESTEQQADKHSEEAEEAGTVELSAIQFQTARIQVGSLQTRTLSDLIRVNGVVNAPPQQQVSVSSPYGGILVSASLLPGTMVRKGQVLAVLENPEFIRLQQDYLETTSRLTFQEQEYERQRDLSQQNVGALKTFQQATAERGSLRARLEGLGQQLALLGIPVSSLQTGKISRTVAIKAPITGTITASGVNRGRFVAANDVLFELVDTRKLVAQLTIFEGDMAKVAIGQRVRMQLTAQSQGGSAQEYSGRILLINRETNADRTVAVFASLTNVPADLRPGTFLKAVIETTSQPVPALPESAVVQLANKPHIFLLEAIEGKGEQRRYRFRPIPVMTGVSENGYQAVSFPQPLPPRHQIVLVGAYDLLSAMTNTEEEGE